MTTFLPVVLLFFCRKENLVVLSFMIRYIVLSETLVIKVVIWERVLSLYFYTTIQDTSIHIEDFSDIKTNKGIIRQ